MKSGMVGFWVRLGNAMGAAWKPYLKTVDKQNNNAVDKVKHYTKRDPKN